MNEPSGMVPPHMPPDEFRRRAHEVVDWIADYLRDVEQHPVLSQCKPGDIRRSLPESPPEKGEPFEAIMADFQRLIVPGLYGYVSATKWLEEIEMTTWEDFDAYWIPRGWAKEGS